MQRPRLRPDRDSGDRQPTAGAPSVPFLVTFSCLAATAVEVPSHREPQPHHVAGAGASLPSVWRASSGGIWTPPRRRKRRDGDPRTPILRCTPRFDAPGDRFAARPTVGDEQLKDRGRSRLAAPNRRAASYLPEGSLSQSAESARPPTAAARVRTPLDLHVPEPPSLRKFADANHRHRRARPPPPACGYRRRISQPRLRFRSVGDSLVAAIRTPTERPQARGRLLPACNARSCLSATHQTFPPTPSRRPPTLPSATALTDAGHPKPRLRR